MTATRRVTVPHRWGAQLEHVPSPPAATLRATLAGGMPIDEILTEFPQLAVEDLQVAWRYPGPAR
jgi:hypothetical protein